MPKLIIIKNPLLPNEIQTFESKEREFTPFMNRFLKVNPEFWDIFEKGNFSLRHNDTLIDDSLRALNLRLKSDDHLIFYPNIEEPGSITAGIILGLKAAVSFGVWGGGFVAGTTSAIGFSIGMMVGGTALSMAISYGTNALFGPDLASSSGPSDDSPSFTWNIRSTAREGIAIPVVYGEMLTGGNIISSAKEYAPKREWEWSNYNGQPLISDIPNFTLHVIGTDKPIRGIEFTIQGSGDQLLFYYRVWDEIAQQKFWTTFYEEYQNGGGIALYDFQEDTDPAYINKTLSKGLVKNVEAAKVKIKRKMREAQAETDSSGTVIDITQDYINDVLVDILSVNNTYEAEDFIYREDNTLVNRDRRTFFSACIYAGVLAAQGDSLTSTYKAQTNWYNKDRGSQDWTVTFDSGAGKVASLGVYVVGGFSISPPEGSRYLMKRDEWELVYADKFALIYGFDFTEAFWLWYIGQSPSPGETYSFFSHDNYETFFDKEDENWVPGLGGFVITSVFGAKYQNIEEQYGTIDGPLSQYDIMYDQYLHRLISLGEGRCSGIKQVYVNDMISSGMTNFSYKFFNGRSDQNLTAGMSNLDNFESWNTSSIFHTTDKDLTENGDYEEFLSTKNFDVDNILIELTTVVYHVTSKGVTKKTKTNELLKFAILVGFEDADFDSNFSYTREPTEDDLYGGNYLYIPYELAGTGHTNAVIGVYPAIPIRDLQWKKANLGEVHEIIAAFPAGAFGMCAWLNLEFDGERFDSARYSGYLGKGDDDTYKELVDLGIQAEVNNLIHTQAKRLKVRIVRLCGNWTEETDNHRPGATDLKVTGFQEVSYNGSNYPSTALLGINFQATSQFSNSIPNITALLKGKMIWVPKLITNLVMEAGTYDTEEETIEVTHELAWFDEDINQYRSMLHNGRPCTYSKDKNGQLEWVLEWSDNPVWCLYDLILSKTYGLGKFTNQSNLPIDWFIDAAEHCDTLVPDGIIRRADSISVNGLSDLSTNFYRNADAFFKDNNTNESGYDDYSSNFESEPDVTPIEIDFVKVILGNCVFARTNDEGWTRAVIGGITKRTSSEPDLTFMKGYVGNGNGNDYWTNGLPISDINNEYYNYYQLGEKRYTLNIGVDNTSSAIDWLKVICDTFRAFPMWVGSGYMPVIDKAQISTKTIGMGNIIKDSFSLAYKPISETHNLIKAQFINRENRFNLDTRQLVDPDVDVVNVLDVKNTVREVEIKLTGITRPSQIDRELAYLLSIGKNNKKLISFGMGIEHLTMTAGNVFSFNHYVLKETTVSGRLLGYEALTDEYVILDQNVSTLSLPLILRVTHIVGGTACPLCGKVTGVITDLVCPDDGTPLNAEEFVGEYEITSIEGKKVYSNFGSIKPAKFNTYELGEASYAVQDYRIIEVSPEENGVAGITAVSYHKENHGLVRNTVCGGITAYNEVGLVKVETTKSARSISSINVTIEAADVLNNQFTVVITEPASTINKTKVYAGSNIIVQNAGGVQVSSSFVSAQIGTQGVIITVPNINEEYNLVITPTYEGGIEGDSIVRTINLNSLSAKLNNEDAILPNPVSNFRLVPKCRPRAEFSNEDYNYFVTEYLHFMWDGGSLTPEDTEFLVRNSLTIAGYRLTIYLRNNSSVWILSKSYTLSKYDIDKKIELYNLLDKNGDDLTNTSSEALGNINGVRTEIVAFSELGVESNPIVEEFYPYVPKPPTKVKVVDLFGSVDISWEKEDDWGNVDKFEVTLTVTKEITIGGERTIVYTSPIHTTTDYRELIKIPTEELTELNSIGFLWGCRLEARVRAVSKIGTRSSTRVTYPETESYTPPTAEDWVLDTASTKTSQVAIPDYMLSKPVSHITVYDKVNSLLTNLSVASHRIDNFSTYENRQKLIDGYLGIGVTYTGLDLATSLGVRITYESPNEEEFSKVSFTVDKECYALVEYLNQDEDGDYLYGDWEYLSGDAGALDADNTLTYYDNVTDALTNMWHLTSSGTYTANFPFNLKNKYIRLILLPVTGETEITLSELRFVRVGTFEELTVDVIKNIDWDSGDEKFYLDANASGEDPVFWVADGGIGGTRSDPKLDLTVDGIRAIAESAIRVGASGEVPWQLIPETIKNRWTTTIIFSSTGRDNISWTGGIINLPLLLPADPYTISSGSQTITANRFVYLDPSVSTSILQTSETYADAFAEGCIFLCRGIYSPDATQKASVITVGALVPVINETNIQDNSISEVKVQTNAISEIKIQTDAVTETKIENDSISTPKLQAEAVTAAKIEAETITANEIATNTITATQISGETITANEIASNAITTDKINANAVTTAKIEVNAITANEIASNAITTDKINANAVTTAKIEVNAITANEIASNAITTDKINANAVTTER